MRQNLTIGRNSRPPSPSLKRTPRHVASPAEQVDAFIAKFEAATTSVTIKGTSKEFVRVGDEGTRATFRFCPECGSTVYYKAEGLAGSIAVPVGAFADPKFPSPIFSDYEAT